MQYDKSFVFCVTQGRWSITARALRRVLLILSAAVIVAASGYGMSRIRGLPKMTVVVDYTPLVMDYDYIHWDGENFLYYRRNVVIHRDRQPNFRSYYRPGWRQYHQKSEEYRENQRYERYRIRQVPSSDKHQNNN